MNKNKDLNLEEVFALALENHQKNNFDAAQNLYNQTLKIDPNHIVALNNLGVILKALDQHQNAISCYEKAIKINPNYAEAHNNLGVIFNKLKQYNKAISCYEKAIKINPNYVEAHNNTGVSHNDLGQYQKAKKCYERAIEINPNLINSHYNLANIFMALADYQKAISCYEKVIEIDPNNINAYNNLGVAFEYLGKREKAQSCYEKVIEIDPNYAPVYNNLGVLLRATDQPKAQSCYEKAIEIDPKYLSAHINLTTSHIEELSDFKKAISSSYETLKIYRDKSTFVNQSVPLFRLKHDVQQAKYLSSKSYKIEGLDQFQKIGEEILNRKENKEDKKILLTPDEAGALLSYNRSDYIYQTKKISGSCINPDKNWQDVEDEYFNSSNQIMYIDNFLSEEALIELREFCLVSKVWNKEYHNKYLGAFSELGFISPIHLQIAKDLQLKLPKLFGPHKLGKLWGFKYDAKLGKGINIHADFAIHNLNFWITPDEYNNNKNSGGLKVYDTPAPDDWPFADYNGDITNGKIYKFLKDNNANCTNIPYKFNRAVLFNSAYFHETDEIDFKDEYEGRRINNTYLFGNRLVKEVKQKYL